ncbi:MAG: allantoinase AllB [Acidobacteriota bacterium]
MADSNPNRQSLLLIRSRRVVLPDGVAAASVRILNGVIESIGPYEEVPEGCRLMDAGSDVVMPGLVDTHVHINEPGRSDWEGFETATRAAAAGGVTTLVDMPLNTIPPTTTVGNLNAKRAAAKRQCYVDVGFWGGVVPGNIADLGGLHEAGVFGFKCFLAPSGVDEFPNVAAADLRETLVEIARLQAVLLVHAELPEPLEEASAKLAGLDAQERRIYVHYLHSRPCQAEDEAIRLLLRLSAETGARLHIVHLSSTNTLEELRQARQQGVAVSIETCPHYLTLAAETIEHGATQFKCAPPVREAEHSDRLWEALREGVIDLIASDHSPAPPRLKRLDSGDFFAAWGGISSLQLALPVVWTAAESRGFRFEHVARWMSLGPSRLAGLSRKGALAAGCDADLVVWDPQAEFRVDPETLFQRHKLTPYAGRRLKGIVRQTFLRGEKIYDQGLVIAEPHGKLLQRGT